MKRIAIFASGSGSNAENIAHHFAGRKDVKISLILSNRPDAFVLERAVKLGIPSVVFNRQEFYETDHVLNLLQDHHVDFIVLAGFLWFVPPKLIHRYPRRIINIHPALLPRHGGKGMYGDRVHRAVIDSGDKTTGITIHYVNEHYDEGEIILRKAFRIKAGDTPETIAQRVHQLEYRHFPGVIEAVIGKL